MNVWQYNVIDVLSFYITALVLKFLTFFQSTDIHSTKCLTNANWDCVDCVKTFVSCGFLGDMLAVHLPKACFLQFFSLAALSIANK